LPDPATGWRALALAAYAAVALLALAGSCNSGHRTDGGTARRIVSIGGPVTETVYALGAGDEVVATDTSSVYPDAATKLPQVGYQRTLTAEGILAQQPDLVIVSADAGPPAALEQLRTAGVTVAVMPPALTPAAAAARIEAIGAALGRDAPAKDLAARLRRDAAAAIARVGHASPTAVLVYARGAGTLLLAGDETAGSAILALAGARNGATGFTGFKPLSAEALIAAAPDVIVVPSRSLAGLGGEAGLLALPGVSDTPAGKTKRIVAIDDQLLLGFGPRLPQAIDELSRRLAVVGTGS
jgi:iron complex transport system substrate-binding protein